MRDTLAGISDSRLGQFAEGWEQIEEFADFPPANGFLLEVLTELLDLAQRAQKEDQMIYCWIGGYGLSQGPVRALGVCLKGRRAIYVQ
ncbi:hypothetical protein ABT294_07555 [Nonomuraea sp. NPDC000554]|uniref:hypothetical protein n=1 Tax=Nonomuraea sp. NPDC000554 TaxID=3154259 RepID=UPI0033194147